MISRLSPPGTPLFLFLLYSPPLDSTGTNLNKPVSLALLLPLCSSCFWQERDPRLDNRTAPLLALMVWPQAPGESTKALKTLVPMAPPPFGPINLSPPPPLPNTSFFKILSSWGPLLPRISPPWDPPSVSPSHPQHQPPAACFSFFSLPAWFILFRSDIFPHYNFI